MFKVFILLSAVIFNLKLNQDSKFTTCALVYKDSVINGFKFVIDIEKNGFKFDNNDINKLGVSVSNLLIKCYDKTIDQKKLDFCVNSFKTSLPKLIEVVQYILAKNYLYAIGELVPLVSNLRTSYSNCLKYK